MRNYCVFVLQQKIANKSILLVCLILQFLAMVRKQNDPAYRSLFMQVFSPQHSPNFVLCIRIIENVDIQNRLF